MNEREMEELFEWCYDETNRVKASKLYKVLERAYNSKERCVTFRVWMDIMEYKLLEERHGVRL